MADNAPGSLANFTLRQRVQRTRRPGRAPWIVVVRRARGCLAGGIALAFACGGLAGLEDFALGLHAVRCHIGQRRAAWSGGNQVSFAVLADPYLWLPRRGWGSPKT